MADKMMRIAGRDPEGKAKALQVDEHGNIHTSVRKTKKIKIIDEVEIRDRGEHYFEFDSSEFERVFYYVINTHNRSFNLHVDIERLIRPQVWDGEDWVRDRSVLVPNSSTWAVLLNTRFPWLSNLSSDSLRFTFQSEGQSDPREGYITLVALCTPK